MTTKLQELADAMDKVKAAGGGRAFVTLNPQFSDLARCLEAKIGRRPTLDELWCYTLGMQQAEAENGSDRDREQP